MIGRGEHALRFEFGENWKRFLELVDEERVGSAVESLTELLERDDLSGLSFLDIGSGSGLFSLAAWRLGADVTSFDIDESSYRCTGELRRRYADNADNWRILHGSVLDHQFVDSLGKHDVVYSWGVLHHTGKMWAALETAGKLVAENGYLVVAIYNDQGRASRYWRVIKRAYTHGNVITRSLLMFACGVYLWGPTLALDILRGSPLRSFRARKQTRGMSVWHDLKDWVGGYPFEVAKPEELFDFFRFRGFRLQRMILRPGIGCNEFVFRRESAMHIQPPAGGLEP